jgi:hypothetical protein
MSDISHDDQRLPKRVRAKIELRDAPVDRDVNGPCWIWAGGWRNNHGYGMTSMGKKKWLAHRLTYTLLVGEIAEGLDLDHLCCVRECCNPLHVEPVTHHENLLRGERAQRTHCPRGHEYAGDNLIVRTSKSRASRRECRACKRAQDRAASVRMADVVLPEGDPRHGVTGYNRYKCKCDICRAADSEKQRRTRKRAQIFAILNGHSLTRPERLAVLSWITTRKIASTNDLNTRELQQVAGTLFSWDSAGHLDAQLSAILRDAA